MPSSKRAIETVHELEQVASAGKILPCVIYNRYEHRRINATDTGALRTLAILLKECQNNCFGAFKDRECQTRARKGTHFFVIVPTRRDEANLHRVGLSAGIENLESGEKLFYVSKGFPYVREFHRLVRAVFESGIVTAHRFAAQPPTRGVTKPKTEKAAVWHHLLIYSYCTGCCFCAFVLFVELAVASYRNRNLKSVSEHWVRRREMGTFTQTNKIH